MDKERRIFGLKKNVFQMGLVSLFNEFSNEMIQSVMPVFLAVSLGVPPVGVGLIEGVADAVSSFVRIFSGWLSDKINHRKLPAILGYVLSVSTRPLFMLAASFTHVLVLRSADRVGKGFREPPRDALLSDSAGKQELGKSFGYHRGIDAVGGIMAPLAAFFILPFINYNYRTLFFIAFCIGLLAILGFVFVKEIKRPENEKPKRLNIGLLKENPPFCLFIAAIFLFGLGVLPITLMLLRPMEIGLVVTNVPLLYFVYFAIFVLAAFPLGKLADRIGERVVISVGFLAIIIAYASLAFSTQIIFSVAAFMFLGLYSAATDGIGRALAAKLISHEMLATGQGLLNAAVGFSSLLAGAIGGLLWTVFNAQVAFLYAICMASVGLMMFLYISFIRPLPQVVKTK